MDVSFFDSLVHVTTDGAWLQTRHNASVERLLQSLQEAAPARACLVGLTTENIPNDFVLAVSRQHPELLVPIASFDPNRSESRQRTCTHLFDLARAGFQGIKLHPRITGFDLSDPKVDWVMDAAAEANLTVFLCTLSRGMSRVPSAPPVDLFYAQLCRHPGTRCILLHGGGTDLLAFSDLVRGLPYVLLDLSFTLLRYRHSSLDLDLRYVLQRLDQKCCVGSDFPEFPPVEAKQRVLGFMADMPSAKIENVMSKNLTSLLEGSYSVP